MKKAVAVRDDVHGIIVDGEKRVSSHYRLPEQEAEFKRELGRLSQRDGKAIRIWNCTPTDGDEDERMTFDEMLRLALGSSGLLDEMEPLDGDRE